MSGTSSYMNDMMNNSWDKSYANACHQYVSMLDADWSAYIMTWLECSQSSPGPRLRPESAFNQRQNWAPCIVPITPIRSPYVILHINTWLAPFIHEGIHENKMWNKKMNASLAHVRKITSLVHTFSFHYFAIFFSSFQLNTRFVVTH